MFTRRSLDDEEVAELKHLQDVFQRYHDHEMEQVKRSSFKWMKGRLAEQQAKYNQLDADWQEKNLESLAELHTSLILNFERQRLMDIPSGEYSIPAPSSTITKKYQNIQTRYNSNDIKIHSPIEEIMIEPVFASPVMTTFYEEEDEDGHLDYLTDPLGNDLIGTCRTAEDMIEPDISSSHAMSAPTSLHKDGNSSDGMRFEVDVPKELLLDYKDDDDEEKRKEGSDKFDDMKNLHRQNHTTDPTESPTMLKPTTSSNVPNQHQAEINKLQQTILSLNLKQDQLTSEIAALRRAAGHPSPGPSPRVHQKMTLASRSYSNASSTASSTATTGGATDSDVVSEQVALAKADMNQQYQNLLNEFTVEHGREVERLKEGNFCYLILLLLFLLLLLLLLLQFYYLYQMRVFSESESERNHNTRHNMNFPY